MEDQEFRFEMTCHIPGKEPTTVVFRSKDWPHFLQTVKRVENALMSQENELMMELNIFPGRKAAINKLARKLALKMIKDGAFQTSLFDTE